MRIALLVMFLLALALSASTTRAEVTTYAVSGVPRDDVLNIRERPSSFSPRSANTVRATAALSSTAGAAPGRWSGEAPTVRMAGSMPVF